MSLARAISPVITFVEEPHGYLVDGREVRSWSQVAKDAGLLPEFPSDAFAQVANAKYRGKQIHEACALIIRGEPFSPQDLHEESLPYVQAFLDYWRGWKGIPATMQLTAETPLYNPDLDYCCTPDFHTVQTVYDIKTTDRPHRTWGLQTAAQALAHPQRTAIVSREIVWLRPKLKSKTHAVLRPPDPRVFSEFDFDVVREACAGLYDGPAITAWKGLTR